MHAHFQAQAAHADGLADVFLAVDDELLRQHMQHLLVGRDVHRLGGLDDAGDVGGGDFFVLTATMPLELKLRIWLPAMPV